MPPSTAFLAYRESLHRDILRVAQGVLDGTVGIVAAVRILASISFALGVEEEEPFTSFRAIDSKTDDYPIGDARTRWNPDALAREDKKLEHYEAQIRESVEEACRVLIARYESPPAPSS